MSELEFRTAGRLAGDDRAQFIHIYEESFPREQRDEPDPLLSSIASGRRRCELVYGDGMLVGLAVLFRLSARKVQFLEYFAIASGNRDQGIGSRFLGHVLECLRSTEDPTPGVVFEVEVPAQAAGGERHLRERRIQFYTRNGAVLVDCAPSYEAPNLAGDGTIPFLLMWIPLGSEVRSLEGLFLRDCVTGILTESYKLHPEHPLVDEVVARLRC